MIDTSKYQQQQQGIRYIKSRQKNYCWGSENHIYKQTEIKIIVFLNYLHASAEKKQGKVIKLIGNHEMMNFSRNIPPEKIIKKVDYFTTFDQVHFLPNENIKSLNQSTKEFEYSKPYYKNIYGTIMSNHEQKYDENNHVKIY